MQQKSSKIGSTISLNISNLGTNLPQGSGPVYKINTIHLVMCPPVFHDHTYGHEFQLVTNWDCTFYKWGYQTFQVLLTALSGL